MADSNDRLGTMLIERYGIERELGSGARVDLYQVGIRLEFAFLHSDPQFRTFVADLGLPIVTIP